MTATPAPLDHSAKSHSSSVVRTPTIIQIEAIECGAAALAIVLAFHGKFVPLEETRIACGISRDGSKAVNIVKAARHYGLTAKGYRRLSSTVLEGPFPSIVLWSNNHFLVVEGRQGSRIRINDPALGRRSVSRDEFDAGYSGIVLTFEKADGFEAGGSPPKLMRRLVGQLAEFRVELAFVLLVGALLAVPTFIAPSLTAVFVNAVLINQLDGWLGPLIGLMAIAAIIQFGLAWAKEITLLRLEIGMALKRSSDFVWRILRLPSAFFSMRYLGDIARQITSVEQVSHLVTSVLGAAAINVLTAAFIYALMMMLDPILASIALLGALVNVLVLRLVHRARLDTSIRLQTDLGKLYGTSVVGLRTIETLKATGGEDDFFSKWAGYHARMLQSEQRLARLEQTSSVVPPFVVLLTTAAILAIGSDRVMEGALSIGALLAFQALLAFVATPVQQLAVAAGRSQEVAANLARINDVQAYPLDWRHGQPEAAATSVDMPAQPERGLELNAVTFGYAALDPPLLEGLTLSVPPGAWMAIVGPSGSGKSTIGKLISGLYQPWHGSVSLDGRSLSTIDRRQLSQLVGLVDQDIALFEGTIRDNISLWDRTVSDEDILDALDDAGMADFFSSLTAGLDTLVDEGGRNFSGGQRQRIEIARALVRAPSLLVLDEATSALDPPTELAIMQALRRRGMTCVVIAHRLSTIRDCDEIVVLDKGKILERGSHRDLMQLGGVYSGLVSESDGT